MNKFRLRSSYTKFIHTKDQKLLKYSLNKAVCYIYPVELVRISTDTLLSLLRVDVMPSVGVKQFVIAKALSAIRISTKT